MKLLRSGDSGFSTKTWTEHEKRLMILLVTVVTHKRRLTGTIREELRLPLCPMADANKDKKALKDYGLI